MLSPSRINNHSFRLWSLAYAVLAVHGSFLVPKEVFLNDFLAIPCVALVGGGLVSYFLRRCGPDGKSSTDVFVERTGIPDGPVMQSIIGLYLGLPVLTAVLTVAVAQFRGSYSGMTWVIVAVAMIVGDKVGALAFRRFMAEGK